MSDTNVDIISIPRERHELFARSAALLDNMLTDPRTADQAESLVQLVNPQAKFPMRERREAIAAPFMGELEKERKAREALEAKIAAREEREAAEAQAKHEAALLERMEKVKAKRGFSDEMMQRVMDRMRDNNSPDVEGAAAFVAESVPKPAPATGHDFLPTTVDPYGATSGDEKWKALHANSDQWLTNELRAISRDPEFAKLGQ